MNGEWQPPSRVYERPEGEGWIEVRALTEAEALERESLGLYEEYLLVSGGVGDAAVQVRRRYDLRAMAEYDFRHSVVAFHLAAPGSDGSVAWEGRPEDPEERVRLLMALTPPLSDWVQEVIAEVNHRLPEQRAEIELAKKN
ncbi:MAG: hypothetical protein HPY69_06060 [Armatimonadetes bacterium]|nr:hypothetical protein [Armatimonadota bacterium]